MFDKILSLLGFQNQKTAYESQAVESINVEEIVRRVRSKEKDIPTGKKICAIDYRRYTISVDREFTGRYRISVFLGNHKIYGFTNAEDDITDQQFATILDEVITFLANDPSPQEMPRGTLLESHFFGRP